MIKPIVLADFNTNLYLYNCKKVRKQTEPPVISSDTQKMQTSKSNVKDKQPKTMCRRRTNICV